MTITKTNNAEGGTNGTAVTAGSGGTSGGASGTYWDLVSTVGGSAIFSTAAKSHGNLGYQITPGSGNLAVLRWTGFNDITGVMRCYFTANTLPASGQEAVASIYTSTGTNIIDIEIKSTGQYVLYNGSNIFVSTNTALAGDRLELSWTIGTTTSNGSYNFSIYRGDSTTALESTSSTTANLGTTNWDRVQFGKTTTSTYVGVYYFDDLAVSSGTTTFFGPAASPPTAAFTDTTVGLDVNVDGTGSTAVSPATISSYSWTWGDSSSSTGSTTTHTYTAAGTYTVTLTVTDSNSQTNSVSHNVTVTAPTTQAQPTSVTSSTGFTSNSGTVLNAITDTSAGQPVLTTFVSGGNASVLVGAIGPVTPPATGQPLVAVISCDRQLSTTGTVTGKLYEKDGVTLRSTATASIPDMTASGGSGTTLGSNSYVSIVWPWTDVQNVVDWNQLVYNFTFNAS